MQPQPWSLTLYLLLLPFCCPASLHVSKPTWWLESRFHFSFADYWDPQRMNFGALRVVNDDFVQPRAGFGSHPHRDAEIFSYVLDGQLSHQDSMGHKEALGRGCVQYISAGTGVVHSVSLACCGALRELPEVGYAAAHTPSVVRFAWQHRSVIANRRGTWVQPIQLTCALLAAALRRK